MNATLSGQQFFRDGGTLPPGFPSYIIRPADAQLRECIGRGEFAYVLAPRQMGKSSLMARTVKDLKDNGCNAAVVDLTKIGESGVADSGSWYRGLLRLVARELKLPIDMKQWWTEREGVTNQQLFYEFFADVVIPSCSGRIVVFIDEIDSTIPLTFSDDFFAGIRALYNARATEPQFNRICFVLLGVATPAELMSDTRRTPFNVGAAIELTDFTIDEAMPLLAGLAGSNEENCTVIERVLYWTEGHPYLTQKVCAQFVSSSGSGSPQERVDTLVDQLFFSTAARKTDHNLAFVAQRLLGSQYRQLLLSLYKKVVAGARVGHDPRSPVQAEIKLAGLLRVADDNTMQVRNNIYRRVFNAAWLREAFSISRLKVAIGIGVPLVAVIVGMLVFWNMIFLPKPYIEALKLAQREDAVSREAYDNLRIIPGKKQLAGKLMASIWERKAIREEVEDGAFPAMLCRLAALKYNDTLRTRREAGRVGRPYGGLELLVRQSEPVHDMLFNRTDNTLALVSKDYSVRILDQLTGKIIAAPLYHNDSISAMAISADGKYIASASIDSTVRIGTTQTAVNPGGDNWNAFTAKHGGGSIRHNGWVTALAFSPDGRRIATASFDKTVHIWNIPSGMHAAGPFRHNGSVYDVAFSPDGFKIVTASFDNTARVWNALTGKPITVPLRHKRSVNSVSFNPNGMQLVTGSSDNTARIWDAATGRLIGIPMKHAGPIYKVLYSPDGLRIATVGEDNTLRIWSAADGSCITGPLKHGFRINEAVFSPDGKYVATACNDWKARIWNVTTGKLVAGPVRHDGAVNAVAFNADGSLFATAAEDNTVRIWNMSTELSIGPLITRESDVWGPSFLKDSALINAQNAEEKVITTAVDIAASVSPDSIEDENRKLISPDGKYTVIASAMKCDYFKVDSSALTPIASRAHAPLFWKCVLQPLNSVASRVAIPLGISDNGVVYDTIDFLDPGKSVLDGKPDSLLAAWQKKLGLRITQNGEVEEMFEGEMYSTTGLKSAKHMGKKENY